MPYTQTDFDQTMLPNVMERVYATGYIITQVVEAGCLPYTVLHTTEADWDWQDKCPTEVAYFATLAEAEAYVAAA